MMLKERTLSICFAFKIADQKASLLMLENIAPNL